MSDPSIRSRHGVLFAIAAYTIWGLAPIYFKWLQQIPALEILAHRIIWSFVLVLLLIVVLGRFDRIKPVLKNRDRKSTRLNSSHVRFSYAVFCLKKKTKIK